MSATPPVPSVWYEQLPHGKSWSSIWSDYTICGRCRGIRVFEGPCRICGDAPFSTEPTLIRDHNGKEYLIPSAFMGAEGRYEDWVYLGMMERDGSDQYATRIVTLGLQLIPGHPPGLRLCFSSGVTSKPGSSDFFGRDCAMCLPVSWMIRYGAIRQL